MASTPRLMILKLEVENFKSYGGVKEIGPFHKSFSSVVGPNGSGKSNVIDCMLFVFGKKSSKLRLNKVCTLWMGPCCSLVGPGYLGHAYCCHFWAGGAAHPPHTPPSSSSQHPHAPSHPPSSPS